MASTERGWLACAALVAGTSLALIASAPVQIRTLDGTLLRPFEPGSVVNVLFFVATDCPVSNTYAPEVQRICADYAPRGAACSLLYEDPHTSVEDVRAHLAQHGYRGMSAAIDRDGAIASAAHATMTPEAVVLDRAGAIRYRGRIDNFFVALGRSRQVVTVHDLRDALTAVLSGSPVAHPETDAVGCYIVGRDGRRQKQ